MFLITVSYKTYCVYVLDFHMITLSISLSSDLPYFNLFKIPKITCPNSALWPLALDALMLLWPCFLSAVHFFAFRVDSAFG